MGAQGSGANVTKLQEALKVADEYAQKKLGVGKATVVEPTATSTSPQSAPPPKKEKSPQPKKEKTPQPKKEKTPQPNNKEVSEKAVSSPRKVEANTETVEIRGARGSSSILLVEACCILSGRKVVVEEGTSFLLTSKSVSLTDPAAAVTYLGWGLGKSDAMQALVLSYLLYAR